MPEVFLDFYEPERDGKRPSENGKSTVLHESKQYQAKPLLGYRYGLVRKTDFFDLRTTPARQHHSL